MNVGYYAHPIVNDNVSGSSDCVLLKLESNESLVIDTSSTACVNSLHGMEFENKQSTKLRTSYLLEYVEKPTNADFVSIAVRDSAKVYKDLTAFYLSLTQDTSHMSFLELKDRMSKRQKHALFMSMYERGRIMLVDYGATMKLNSKSTFNPSTFSCSYLSRGHQLVEASALNANFLKSTEANRALIRKSSCPFNRSGLITFEDIKSQSGQIRNPKASN